MPLLKPIFLTPEELARLRRKDEEARQYFQRELGANPPYVDDESPQRGDQGVASDPGDA